MSNEDYLNNVLSAIRSELHNADLIGSHLGQTIAFLKAIDWTQPWILCILGFHTICFIVSILLRNKHNWLSIYFFILLGFAALTQPLNNLGMKHWNGAYFDTSGLFIVCVYSFPLILNCLFTLIWILKATISMLIQTKTLQLKQKLGKNYHKKTN
ncbi:MAG: transmembrane protein 18-domain-containing protein [Benjaminiella poitrasii]|nr:MAG: transmembrane protein 18-domain-containing protein [Benjaminiella poitrasii]